MFPARLFFVPLFLLTACATPQERCIREGAAEETRLRAQITEAEGNIERGYAIHRQIVPETVFHTCQRVRDGKIIGYYPCPETYYRAVETPVAIQVSEERKKLATLKSALPGAVRRSEDKAAQCRAVYPS